jgi:hypothetical protein
MLCQLYFEVDGRAFYFQYLLYQVCPLIRKIYKDHIFA